MLLIDLYCKDSGIVGDFSRFRGLELLPQPGGL